MCIEAIKTQDMDFLTYLPPWLLPAVVILTISCILMLWTKPSKGASGLNLPPGPPSLPLIGNLHQLIGKSFHETVYKLAEKYGPIMHIYMGSQPVVVISSSALATEAFKTHDHILANRQYSNNLRRLTFDYNDIAWAPYGDHSKHMRRVLVTEFLNSRMSKSFKKVLDMEVKNMLDNLPYGTETNLNKVFGNFVCDFTSKVVTGKSYRDVKIRGKTMKEMLDEMIILFSGSFSEIFPKYGWILEDLSGWTRRVDKHMANYNDLLELMIDEHLDHTNEDEKDMIDACRPLLNREEMKAIMSNVYNGAIDTSYLTLVWAMSEIVKNPRVMRKLQDEIRSNAGYKARLDETDTSKMTYLKYVVKETLRRHGPSPFLIPRDCVSHIQIGGYDILPGAKVLINAWGIAKDPKVWTENANEFHPDRFENHVLEQFHMVPFGGGRRACPGYNFATLNIEVVLANLLYTIDWKLPPGLTLEDFNMEEEGSLLVTKKTPLYLVPNKHNTQA
ncbi:putative cytochrome P450 [Helianthus debilis subsp. tardiflorus]